MATAMTISRSAGPGAHSDNSNNTAHQQHPAELCQTCKQPLSSSSAARHAAFSPESLPSIPLLPSINESGVSPPAGNSNVNAKTQQSSPSLLTVNTSVTETVSPDKQVPLSLSPHTVGEEKAKARARGWSMVDEDAEKAKRELTWSRYRQLVRDVCVQDDGETQEGLQETQGAINILKETLLKVLQEAEQLSNDHYALQHREKELQMNLKIARSNLQLAEMNSEMLEEALRRGGEGFAGRMLPLPNHQQYSNKTSIDTVRTEGSRPETPNLGTKTTNTGARGGADTAAAARAASGPGGMRSTSMTIPFSGGGSAAAAMIPPQIVRRKSGSEAGQAVGSATAATSTTTNKPATPTAIPQSARPAMERSNTMGSATSPAAPPPSTSAGTGIGGFFRKNFDKRSSGLMQDLGLQNLRIPDLQNLPIPSPSAATRAEFFNSLGMSNTGAASSSPNLAITTNGFNTGSSPTMQTHGSLSRSPLQARPTNRGGWYDAAAPDSSLGGASDAEVQKLRATLVATSKSVTTLKSELGAMKTAKAELEAELESLSQALFEEANKMVADERKKRAEKEQEAKEAIEEREALRRVVKLMEAEKAGRPTSDLATRDSGEGLPKGEASQVNGMSESKTEPRHIPGGFPLSAESDKWTDKADALNASTNIQEQPKRNTAEELEELMKRMEADFGKL